MKYRLRRSYSPFIIHNYHRSFTIIKSRVTENIPRTITILINTKGKKGVFESRKPRYPGLAYFEDFFFKLRNNFGSPNLANNFAIILCNENAKLTTNSTVLLRRCRTNESPPLCGVFHLCLVNCTFVFCTHKVSVLRSS